MTRDEVMQKVLRIVCPCCELPVRSLIETQNTDDAWADYKAALCEDCYRQRMDEQLTEAQHGAQNFD
jgi:hypothetical protein